MQVRYREIEIAVIIIVRRRRTTAQHQFLEIGSCQLGNVVEAPRSVVFEKLRVHLVRLLLRSQHVTIRHENVHRSITVNVERHCAEPVELVTGRRHTGASAVVDEQQPSQVSIESVLVAEKNA